MNKTNIIIQREYLTRVRKKSFLIMTILGPILMASIWVIPLYLANMSDEVKRIEVLDETGLFADQLRDTETMKFIPVSMDITTAKANLTNSGDYALLHIPQTQLNIPVTAMLYSASQPSIAVKSYIREVMQKRLESLKLETSGIDPAVLQSIKSTIYINTIRIDSSGTESKSFTEVSMVLGIFAGILIYFFIFMFGAQVMRGVIEEKTSRIIEVIVSSVKPFQLMMGKIIGVAAVGLTQFLLWVFLTLAIVTVFQVSILDDNKLTSHEKMFNSEGNIMNPQQLKQFSQRLEEKDNLDVQILEAISSVNYGVMVASFLFYFLAGYLLYAALFAAIGAAVDSEADTQQFMFPITIPLIFSIIMAQFVTSNPDGPVAFWLSVIPLTSPVIMMVRIPFGVPFWEVGLSMALLVLTFIGTTWLAAKIYRTGILMYGKKVNYRELWKWVRVR